MHFFSSYVPCDPPISPSVIFIYRIIFGVFLMCEDNFHLVYTSEAGGFHGDGCEGYVTVPVSKCGRLQTFWLESASVA